MLFRGPGDIRRSLGGLARGELGPNSRRPSSQRIRLEISMEVAQGGGVVIERSGHLRVGRSEQRCPDGGRLAPERLGVSVLALPACSNPPGPPGSWRPAHLRDRTPERAGPAPCTCRWPARIPLRSSARRLGRASVRRSARRRGVRFRGRTIGPTATVARASRRRGRSRRAGRAGPGLAARPMRKPRASAAGTDSPSRRTSPRAKSSQAARWASADLQAPAGAPGAAHPERRATIMKSAAIPEVACGSRLVPIPCQSCGDH